MAILLDEFSWCVQFIFIFNIQLHNLTPTYKFSYFGPSRYLKRNYPKLNNNLPFFVPCLIRFLNTNSAYIIREFMESATAAPCHGHHPYQRRSCGPAVHNSYSPLLPSLSLSPPSNHPSLVFPKCPSAKYTPMVS